MANTVGRMAYGKTKAFVAGALLAMIPLGIQWDENRQIKRELVALKALRDRPLPTRSSAGDDRLRRGSRPSGYAEQQATETLLGAMKGSEFAGIDFCNLPTAQKGMDEVFIRIFSESSQTERKRLFALLLDSITPEQAPLLVKSMRLRGRLGVPGHEEYRWLLDRWGDIDGEAATSWAFKIDGDDGYKATQCTNIVIKAWTRHEPEAALNWLASQQDIPLKNGMREGLLAGIMDFHPDKAPELLEAMKATPAERTQAHQLMATRVSRMEGPEALDAWLAALPEETPEREKIENHVTRIHLDHGVAHAVAWAGRTPERLTEVLDHYAAHSPEPLFEYYAGQDRAVDPLAESVLQKAAATWTRENPDLMGIWLRDHMGSPNYETIASLFVETIRPIDPDAAKAWAETMEPKRKNKNVSRAVLQFFQEEAISH